MTTESTALNQLGEKSMNTENTLSVEQLTSTLNQIATDMKSIKSILDDAVTDGRFNHRDASIELIASRSGVLADSLAKALGMSMVQGGLEEWFDGTVPILNTSATESAKE